MAIIATGEPFPADGLILAGTNLQADESALTGEAMPVKIGKPSPGGDLIQRKENSRCNRRCLGWPERDRGLPV
jgi:magnesium-transporting ATPase (P-type)